MNRRFPYKEKYGDFSKEINKFYLCKLEKKQIKKKLLS